mmetsp:Transcript_83915/g.211601  ORF Transcript_83915/g.211601 Transcript_83915/m.211601 type:complete len:208 (-) Transcript_83915:726-1349(-)
MYSTTLCLLTSTSSCNVFDRARSRLRMRPVFTATSFIFAASAFALCNASASLRLKEMCSFAAAVFSATRERMVASRAAVCCFSLEMSRCICSSLACQEALSIASSFCAAESSWRILAKITPRLESSAWLWFKRNSKLPPLYCSKVSAAWSTLSFWASARAAASFCFVNCSRLVANSCLTPSPQRRAAINFLRNNASLLLDVASRPWM